MIATSWLAPESVRDIQKQAILDAVASGVDWGEYLLLVDRHRTPALSWSALNGVPDLSIRADIQQQLKERNDACRRQAILHCQALAKLMRAFNYAGIPFMNPKGPIMSFQLYGDVGLRQCKDLDLVVKPEDIDRARTCLGELGWQIDSTLSSMTPRQWEKFWKMEDDLILVDPRTRVNVELHSRICRDSPDADVVRWARSCPSIWQGGEHQVMQPADQLLYLCDHGTDHCWFRAKWLGDLARLHASGQANWRGALEESVSTGMDKPLRSCLQLLDGIYQLPMPLVEKHFREEVPAFLIREPLRALQVSAEPPDRSALQSLPDFVYSFRLRRLQLPRKGFRVICSEFLYCRQDFQMIRLPDRLFWAYVPLRPLLFLWRKSTLLFTRLSNANGRPLG